MRIISIVVAALSAWIAVPVSGQALPARMVGTIASIKADTAEVEIKPDAGASVLVKLTAETLFQRVAPGEKDLRKAEAIHAADLAKGDRVLVVLLEGTDSVRRIVVMSANDIAKRNEADRQDWTKRGVSGVVASKKGDEITLKMRSFTGETQVVVTITPTTTYKRYAPDSVKFADASKSNIGEVAVGDQLRARGQKSEDGLKVTAEDVVFGTFVTKAGTVTAVNLETKEITVKDLSNNKPLVIKLTADSQLKKLPNFGAMMGGRAGGPGAPGAGGVPGAGAPGGAPASGGRGGAPGAGGMMGGGPPRAFDMSQMLERMPAAKLEDLKPGETIVVSSTKGNRTDQVTAIMLLSNADMLIQMAAAQSRTPQMGMGGGMSMGGMSGGLGGLELPGMIP